MSFENEKIYFKCIIVFSFTGSKVAVVLHTSISDDEYFKRSKLTPDHNNVRRYYLSQLPNQSDDIQNSSNEFQDSSDDPPTPHYNASLLLELGGRERHLVTLYSALHNSPGLIDAVLLCKVWARQRGLDEVLCSAVSCFFSFCLLWWLQLLELKLHVLHWAMNFTIILVYWSVVHYKLQFVKNIILHGFCVQGIGGLSGFHFSMLVTWLRSQRRLNAHMSSYQTFRVIMQTFVASDWTTKGTSMSQVQLYTWLLKFFCNKVIISSCFDHYPDSIGRIPWCIRSGVCRWVRAEYFCWSQQREVPMDATWGLLGTA